MVINHVVTLLTIQYICCTRTRLPDLRAIVLFDGNTDVPGVITWDELLNIGFHYSVATMGSILIGAGRDQTEASLAERLSNIAVNQCCVVSYTSGTTGNPKGVMLSHDNIVYTALTNLSFNNIQFGQGRAISYLPQSHMAGMMLDQFICMANGSLCCFADKFAITQGAEK